MEAQYTILAETLATASWRNDRKVIRYAVGLSPGSKSRRDRCGGYSTRRFEAKWRDLATRCAVSCARTRPTFSL